MANDSNNVSVSVSMIDNDRISMIAVSDGIHTAFAGVADNKETDFIMYSAEKAFNLLVTAVNNRTRERNYFKKYSEFLDNEISEDDFDNEIDNNEDDYVVPAGIDASIDDVKMALHIAPLLKGIHSTDDFTSLFSFTDKSVQKCIESK